eukprot:scaffold65895_cov19-Tisochrysis_lutea.AAC.2
MYKARNTGFSLGFTPLSSSFFSLDLPFLDLPVFNPPLLSQAFISHHACVALRVMPSLPRQMRMCASTSSEECRPCSWTCAPCTAWCGLLPDQCTERKEALSVPWKAVLPDVHTSYASLTAGAVLGCCAEHALTPSTSALYYMQRPCQSLCPGDPVHRLP